MTENPVFFYVAAFILVVFTMTSLFLRNIIYSLLSSIMVFFSGALIFYLLGSEYNAIIQAAIYGLAVPVIIGISIMFSGYKWKNKKTDGEKQSFALRYTVLMCLAIFVLFSVYVTMISLALMPDTFNRVELLQVNSYDVISSFAKGIFIEYVWGFELLSLLLTIVIAGLTLFNRRMV